MDTQRPQYHYLPPANWMNDPNGLIPWKGKYHLFYQYNPHGAFHGTIHWGHAVSEDLVHWRDLPIALAPTPEGPDKDGCWSGCAVDNDGVPTLIYSGVFPQVVCLATSSDDLLTWHKFEGNPVIQSPPGALSAATGGDFRDPFVWKEGDDWYLMIGSKIEGKGGMILLYQSKDLINWAYKHPVLVGNISQGDPFWTGTMWECPNYLDFGDRQGIIFSIQASSFDHLYAVYHTGTYHNHHFTSETQGILVHGGYFYAPQVLKCQDGRYLLWGWIKEGRSQRISEWAGWSGLMSLPLLVSLRHDGKVSLEPIPELEALRSEHWSFENLPLGQDTDELFADPLGDCLEIHAEFEVGRDSELGLKLRCSPDGQEQTRLVYKSDQNLLVIERDQSSVSADVERNECFAKVELAEGHRLQLHIFLDRSVIEVFVNGGSTCLVSRIYPLRPDSLGVGLFSRKGSATFKSLDIWRLDSIWE